MIQNPVSIDYSPKFEKQLIKVPRKIKVAFLKRRELFNKDPVY